MWSSHICRSHCERLLYIITSRTARRCPWRSLQRIKYKLIVFKNMPIRTESKSRKNTKHRRFESNSQSHCSRRVSRSRQMASCRTRLFKFSSFFLSIKRCPISSGPLRLVRSWWADSKTGLGFLISASMSISIAQ